MKQLLILTAPLLVASQVGAADNHRVFVGYFASFADNEVAKIPWRHLTHVSHAYLRTDESGNLVTNERMPNANLTAAAHEQGVQVLLSLGGGRTTGGLERVTTSRQSIEQYAAAVVKLVAENDYDGVDLVWEFPRDRTTRTGFVALVATLRQQLDKQATSEGREEGYLLTAAVSPSGFFGKWIDIGAVMSRIDWLHVTSYDMAGPWSRTAGHHAPLFPSPSDPQRGWRSVSQAMTYWHKDRGVPKAKIVMGIPLYGRVYPVAEPFAELPAARREQHRTITFTKLRELIGRGWPAEWDAVSQAPWLRPPAEEQFLIAYDDRNSVDKKAEWARGEGYRGLAFWAVHQDRMSDGTHWLLRAAEKAWPAEPTASHGR